MYHTHSREHFPPKSETCSPGIVILLLVGWFCDRFRMLPGSSPGVSHTCSFDSVRRRYENWTVHTITCKTCWTLLLLGYWYLLCWIMSSLRCLRRQKQTAGIHRESSRTHGKKGLHPNSKIVNQRPIIKQHLRACQ